MNWKRVIELVVQLLLEILKQWPDILDEKQRLELIQGLEHRGSISELSIKDGS